MHQESLSLTQVLLDMFFEKKTDPSVLSSSARAMSDSLRYQTNRWAEINKFREATKSAKAVRRFYPNSGPQIFRHPEQGMSPAKNYGFDFADKRTAIFA